MTEQVLAGRHLLAPAEREKQSTMPVLLVLVAVLAGLAGLVTLSQATMGVGMMAAACLCAILARMAQAHAQHAALMRRDRSE